MKLLLALVAGAVLAGAGFAGGWLARSPAPAKQCGVLPAYTEPTNSYLPTTVHPPELVCK